MFAISEAAWERYDPLSLEFELLQRTVADWRQHARDRAEDALELQKEGAALQHRYEMFISCASQACRSTLIVVPIGRAEVQEGLCFLSSACCLFSTQHCSQSPGRGLESVPNPRVPACRRCCLLLGAMRTWQLFTAAHLQLHCMEHLQGRLFRAWRARTRAKVLDWQGGASLARTRARLHRRGVKSEQEWHRQHERRRWDPCVACET